MQKMSMKTFKVKCANRVRVDMVKRQKEKKKFPIFFLAKGRKRNWEKTGKIKYKEQKYKDNLVIN